MCIYGKSILMYFLLDLRLVVFADWSFNLAFVEVITNNCLLLWTFFNWFFLKCWNVETNNWYGVIFPFGVYPLNPFQLIFPSVLWQRLNSFQSLQKSFKYWFLIFRDPFCSKIHCLYTHTKTLRFFPFWKLIVKHIILVFSS